MDARHECRGEFGSLVVWWLFFCVWCVQYREAVNKCVSGARVSPSSSSTASSNSLASPLSSFNPLEQKQRSFLTFGFGAGSGSSRRESHINVNVTPAHDMVDTPEIRKYKKRFNSEVLCASLWGKSFAATQQRPTHPENQSRSRWF